MDTLGSVFMLKHPHYPKMQGKCAKCMDRSEKALNLTLK